MKFIAEIDIMPHKELLDPQGKAVKNNIKSLDVHGVEDVRIGKHIRLFVEAANMAEAEQMVDTACKKMLANQIMESYHFELTEA
jgi:phosphoribosylformylglycinamidine synthase